VCILGASHGRIAPTLVARASDSCSPPLTVLVRARILWPQRATGVPCQCLCVEGAERPGGQSFRLARGPRKRWGTTVKLAQKEEVDARLLVRLKHVYSLKS